MAASNLATVTNQIQKFWSPLFMQELRAAIILPGLVNKDYEGEIKQGGDTVYVSQINAPAGENRSTTSDGDAFASEQLSLSRISVVANQRAIAAYEFSDLVTLQSQIGQKDSEIRAALTYAVGKKINDYLYSLVAPSASAPDHLINSTAAFNAAALRDVRKRAAIAKWLKNKPWYCLLDPAYYSDLMDATTMVSSDFAGAAGDAPLIGGEIVAKRYGFNIIEDNGLATSQGVAFHPDFLHLVMQPQIQYKVSDLHSNKKFGYVISADIIYGAGLGIAGANKHQLVCASASATSVVMS